MKLILSKFSILSFFFLFSLQPNVQEFQGQAYYFSKSKMELGSWGARMSEAQKKQIRTFKEQIGKNLCLKFQ